VLAAFAATTIGTGCILFAQLDEHEGSAGPATDASAAEAGHTEGGADVDPLCGVAADLVFKEPGEILHPLPWEPETQWALLDRGKCPVALRSELGPTVGVVVLNATGSPRLLSAWGHCTASAGFVGVAFYRGSTIPDGGPGWCEVYSAIGPADFEVETPSPENAGSLYCNGLRPDAGGALSLGACERAYVRFQYEFNVLPDSGRVPGATFRLE